MNIIDQDDDVVIKKPRFIMEVNFWSEFPLNLINILEGIGESQEVLLMVREDYLGLCVPNEYGSLNLKLREIND